MDHGSVMHLPSPLVGQQQVIIRAVLTAIYEIYSKDSDPYLNELCTLLVVQRDIIITK